MKTQTYALSLQEIPVDLFADPDGAWSYEALVAAAGLDPEMQPPAVIGALTEPWQGHPDGAAVVAAAADGVAQITIIECGVAAVSNAA
jgi:hypothetical protein